MRVPQAVSVVTEEQLDDRNPQTLSDAVGYTPGVRIGAYGLDPRSRRLLHPRPARDEHTGIFRDGLREFNIGFSTFDIEPYGLEGLSILKGRRPASTDRRMPAASSTCAPSARRGRLRARWNAEVGSNSRVQLNLDRVGAARIVRDRVLTASPASRATRTPTIRSPPTTG